MAEQNLEEIEDKISKLQEMRATLTHLVKACAGDDRPDCPILENFARKHDDEERSKEKA